MRARRLTFAAVVAILAFSWLAVPSALAQTQSLYWERFDVNIAVQTNGDLRVQETQVINFTSGVFHEGFAEISTANTDGITDVTVSENGQAYRFVGSSSNLSKGEYSIEPILPDSSGIINVTWGIGATRNQTRTFVLAYTAHGVIRRYAAGNEFQWNAISPSKHDYEIRASTETIDLPAGATLSKADYLVPPGFSGVPMEISQTADKLSASWVATRAIAPSEGVQIVVQFAANTVGGAAPTWQAAFDKQKAWDDNVRPWLDLGLGTLGLLVLLGGPAVLYLLWYLRGRDPQIDAVPEYITAPPAGLLPGIAGTLVDEKADVQDIIATLMDLARRGYLVIEESSETSAFRLVSKEFTLRQTLESKRLEDLADFERQLYTAVFQNRPSVKMRDLNQRFYSNIPGLQQALYNSSVKMGYFSASPSSVRSQYGCLGGFLLVAAIVGGIALAIAFSDFTSTLLCPFMAAAVVSIILMWLGQHMPVKSRQGAEAAALSKAFKNYLTNLEKYAKPEQVTEQFDKYLPFAIAFGLERTWINRFSRIPTTPMPGWYYPVGRPFIAGPMGMGMATTAAGHGPLPTTSAGVPSLQGMSDGLSGGLQGMSDGLNTMLNSAARTLTSTPPASNTSSGGRSFSGGGGGFHSSGGSGGGGRGFR
jgi:uncharacterized membrane protein YgcG